jgi:hypothetical protein
MKGLLDAGQVGHIYRARVRDVIFEGATSTSRPRAVLVGAQPGAGKTAATQTAMRMLRSTGQSAVLINGDELRPFHPLYEALIKADQATAAERTGADVGLWVKRAILEAAEMRCHTVVETTMRQPAVVARTVQLFKGSGFEVDMRVVVVHPEVSRQSIYTRFRDALEVPGSLPRFTLPRYHDDAYAAMPATLEATSDLVDRVQLVDRQGQLRYDSHGASVSPREALANARLQPLPTEQALTLAEDWHRLARTLNRDGVPALVREGVLREQARFDRFMAVLRCPSTSRPEGLQRPDGGQVLR